MEVDEMTKPIVTSITDEQLEELEDYLGQAPDGMMSGVKISEVRGLIARLRAAEKELAAVKDGANHRAIMSLRADCESLRKDAERYRWLRGEKFLYDFQNDSATGSIWGSHSGYANGLDDLSWVDKAIDDSMGRQHDQH